MRKTIRLETEGERESRLKGSWKGFFIGRLIMYGAMICISLIAWSWINVPEWLILLGCLIGMVSGTTVDIMDIINDVVWSDEFLGMGDSPTDENQR